MSEIIHQSRGWHAVLKPRRITLKYRLPGDTPDLVRSLRVLVSLDMLPANAAVPPTLPCPRCQRPTATAQVRDDRGEYQLVAPSVCTGCRVEWISAHAGWDVRPPDTAAADAEVVKHQPKQRARVVRQADDDAGQCKGDGCNAIPLGGGEYCQSCRLLAKMRAADPS